MNLRTSDDESKFVIVISNYSNDSLLAKNIELFELNEHVSTVYILNPKESFSPNFNKIKTIADETYANFRFIPPIKLQSCVFLCNGDAQLDEESLNMGFRAWKNAPNALVGYFPGLVNSNVTNIFNYLHTDGLFISSEFLYNFNCLLPPHVHLFLQSHPECSSMALNMFSMGTSKTAPIKIDLATAHDRKDNLQECYEQILPFFEGLDPLLKSSISVTSFKKISIKKKKIEEWK